MAGSAHGDTEQSVAVAGEWKQLNPKLYRESHEQGFAYRMPCKMQSILAVGIHGSNIVPMQQSIQHIKLQL